MCVHTSPSPAMQLQCAQQTTPVALVIMQHFKEVSFRR